MTQDQISYQNSYRYEAFMKRAHRSARNFERGIDNSVFLKLNNIANGHTSKKENPAKQIAKIKNYLAKAIDKVLKWKLNPEEEQLIRFQAAELAYANDEDTLAEVISALLDATQRFND